MSLLAMVLLIIGAGVGLYLVNAFVPMETRTKSLLNWFVIIVLVLLIAGAFGLWSELSRVQVPRLGR